MKKSQKSPYMKMTQCSFGSHQHPSQHMENSWWTFLTRIQQVQMIIPVHHWVWKDLWICHRCPHRLYHQACLVEQHIRCQQLLILRLVWPCLHQFQRFAFLDVKYIHVSTKYTLYLYLSRLITQNYALLALKYIQFLRWVSNYRQSNNFSIQV